MDNFDEIRINILLHEYDTLREESIENVNRQTTYISVISTIIIAASAWSISTDTLKIFWILPILILVFISLEFGRQFSIRYKGLYLKLIEERINEIVGEQLLTWQSFGTPEHLHKLYRSNKKNKLNYQYLISIQPVFLICMLIIFIYGLISAKDFLINWVYWIYLVSVIGSVLVIFISRFKKDDILLNEYKKEIIKHISNGVNSVK